jgi:hypothetical protein
MSWGTNFDRKMELKSEVEEFFNKSHDKVGRFTSGDGGTAETPSAENGNHVRDAQKSIAQAKEIVGTDSKEGIVLDHVHKTLSLYTVGKLVSKGNAISGDLKKKFAAADEWLKTDPTPEKVGLVHKLVNKAKAALSYMTGGDLAHFAYINASAGVLGLAAHFATGLAFPVSEGSKKLWPPPGWGHRIAVH